MFPLICRFQSQNHAEQKYLTPFLPSNQVPGSFRPIVYPLQDELRFTDGHSVNSVASHGAPLATRKPFYALSEHAEHNVANLIAKPQKNGAQFRPIPIPQIIQYVSSTPAAALSGANDPSIVLRVKPTYKKLPKQRPPVEYGDVRPSVQVATTEATPYQSHGSYLPSAE